VAHSCIGTAIEQVDESKSRVVIYCNQINSMKMKYLFLIAVLFVIASCKKEVEVDIPDLDVTLEKTTFNVKDTIVFNFTGKANIITFYSGEPGKEYEFKDRFTVDGRPEMQFTSYSQNGPQFNTLQLMVSSDFKNVFDVESLNQATWKDITSRATLSTGTDNTPSGIIDLSDVTIPDTPVYIAFRYTGKKSTTVSQPTWTIKNVVVNNRLENGSTVQIANSSNLSWGTIDVLNNTKSWSATTTQIQIAGGAIGTDDNDDWIISKPLSLNRIQRSLGISVRSNPTTLQTSYIFPGYSTPGTYTVTFEAINANRWDSKTIIKEFTITVQ
jgi:hypothetical protein